MQQCEVLRLLGAQGDGRLERDIEKCRSVISRIARPRGYHITADIVRQGGRSYIASDPPLELLSEDLLRMTSGCEKAVIFAATLGGGIDAEVRRLSITDMAFAVVLDACASSEIEDFCDEYTRRIECGGLFMTDRFSPGYGDFSLAQQADIMKILGAEKRLGLYLTEGGALCPFKSVTAVIGLSDTPQPHRPRCEGCNMKDRCAARRRQQGGIK